MQRIWWCRPQVNSRTVEGSTPLFYSCAVGSAPCAEVLLQWGAQPVGPLHLPSPLHEASSRGNACGVGGGGGLVAGQ